MVILLPSENLFTESQRSEKNVIEKQCAYLAMKSIVALDYANGLWLRRCSTKPTVVGSILADSTTLTDFVPFSKVLKPDWLFRTYGCAEAFIPQWIDTAWNLFFVNGPNILLT